MKLIYHFTTLAMRLGMVGIMHLICLQMSFAQQPKVIIADTNQTPVSANASERFRHFRLEATGFDHMVSNRLGHWWGGGLELSWRAPARATISASIQSEQRPGEEERYGVFRTVVDLSKHVYIDASIGAGGPDSPAAYFPRYRYDWTMNLKVPRVPGLIFFGGATRLQFGTPVRGDILRTGAILYWRRFVFQSNVNMNNSRPGNRRSLSSGGAFQYGQEGRYWMGVSASGGHEAWQTLGLRPQDVDFSSNSASIFGRKWLTPAFGVAGAYNYSLKRTAYHMNGLEFKVFAEF